MRMFFSNRSNYQSVPIIKVTIIGGRLYSFLNRKNVSPEVFLGAKFDKGIQNWAKILGTV